MGGFGDFFQDYVIDPVKNTTRSHVNILSGDGNTKDWENVITGGEPLQASLLEEKPEATVEGEDPRVTALRQRSAKEAKEFRENLPEYKESQMRPERLQANQSERQGRQNVKRASSRRGLLDSGIRERGEADVATQKASTLAEARYNINRNAEELANLKSDIATGIGISDTGAMLNQQQAAQDRAREEAAQRRAAYSQIGQGLGYGVGALGNFGGSTPITDSGYNYGGGLLTGSGGSGNYLGANTNFNFGGSN